MIEQEYYIEPLQEQPEMEIYSNSLDQSNDAVSFICNYRGNICFIEINSENIATIKIAEKLEANAFRNIERNSIGFVIIESLEKITEAILKSLKER